MTPLKRMMASARQGGRLFRVLLYVLDAAVIVLATIIAYYVRFEGNIPSSYAKTIPAAACASIVVYLALFTAFGLYRLVLRYVSIDTMLRVGAAVLIGCVMLFAIDHFAPKTGVVRAVPFGVIFIQALLVMIAVSGVRAAARVMVVLRSTQGSGGHRVLIVGAGSAGSLLLNEIHSRPELGLTAIGFLDDNPRLQGHTIRGVRVIGTTDDLPREVTDREIEQVLVAIPSAPQSAIRRVLNAAAEAGVTTRIMPQLVIEKGSVSVTDLRKVEVEDLLGREQTPIDAEQVRHTLAGKVVAVTGAAGSIGSELCRQILPLEPERLVLIETDETRLYELFLELDATYPGVSAMSVCDIRDAGKLEAVFSAYEPQVVLHAAAYKHVPLMELAPEEAVKTNVLGTLQVIEACERHDVERFVLISTDKAVAPVNVMGLTKSLAEREMLDATRRGKLAAVAVRFGNVLASRGSVVPIFEEQLRRGGPLTVTHPDVTRYFMSIPEASRLVLQAQAIGKPGDIFVLEMGEPVKIVDLARKMIVLSGVPADIEFVGLRPGEKLHEVLTSANETLRPTERDRILRVERVLELDATFETDIRRLIAAAVAGDTQGIADTIERLEPGFSEREAAED